MSDPIVIRNSVFRGNSASQGGAVLLIISTGSADSLVDRCIFDDNYVSSVGAAVYLSTSGNAATLRDCLISDNSAISGGGVYVASSGNVVLENCTIVENIARSASGAGGGIHCNSAGALIRNCIVWGNENLQIAGAATSDITCCAIEGWGSGGTGNIAGDPLFEDVEYHLNYLSPCLDGGSNGVWMSAGTDLEGYSRINNDTVDIGAYEMPRHFADANGTNAIAPYTSWATAAATIQDAVDLAVEEYTVVVVTNGVYDEGSASVADGALCRVAITRAIGVYSIGGAADTLIVGEGPEGNDAVRCVYVGSNAWLNGFTLTNGHTRTSGDSLDMDGGGAWCEASGLIEKCVIVDCSATHGGGVFGGALSVCAVLNNTAHFGGGAYSSALWECDLYGNTACSHGGGAYQSVVTASSLSSNEAATYGGGAAYSEISDCNVAYNSALAGGGLHSCMTDRTRIDGNTATYGAGIYAGTNRSCLVVGNQATSSGGGMSDGVIENCTVVSNSGPQGGGTDYGTVKNCIVWENAPSNWFYTALTYSCTTPAASGTGNIVAVPGFMDVASGDYRLLPDSPCVDRGEGAAWMNRARDLDGNWRAMRKAVDMGGYETWQPLNTVLALDMSDSMNAPAGDMDLVKHEALGVVNNLYSLDMVGAIEFNTTAQTVSNLTRIAEEADKGRLNEKIHGLSARYQTAIGSGLTAAQNQLDQLGNTNDVHHIVLLTDGDILEEDYIAGMVPGIHLHTILPPSVWLDDWDQNFNSWLAQRRNGAFLASPTLAGTMTIDGGNVVMVDSGEISGSATNEHTAPIDSTVNHVTFRLNWEYDDSHLAFAVESPGSLMVTPAVAATMEGVVYSEYDGSAVYEIDAPTNGQWKMHVSNGTDGQEYCVGVSVSSWISANLHFDRLQYSRYEGIPISVFTSPYVTNAWAVVTNTWNDCGNVVELHDDGQHADGAAGDGIFGGSYSNTTAYRSWRIQAYVEGAAPDGSAFLRAVEKSVYVHSSATQLDTPLNVEASDGAYTNEVLITWSNVTDAVYYDVYRDYEDTRADASLIGVASGNSLVDSNAVPGSVYYYWVKAYRRHLATFDSEFSDSDTGYAAP